MDDDVAGFGRSSLLFFYTAAGGSNQWSADNTNRFTQRLDVSQNGGNTLQKKGLILGHIKGENRDPKVFRHRESGAWVMALYLDGNEFGIFRSEDLLHWEESQRITADGMMECPDLFELKVSNRPGERKWVFWSAGGQYMVGDFDGYRFVPESGVVSAYETCLPYAAQTFSGVSGRTVSMAWLRTENDKGGFRGIMSLPAELSLIKRDGSLRIRFKPVEEL